MYRVGQNEEESYSLPLPLLLPSFKAPSPTLHIILGGSRSFLVAFSSYKSSLVEHFILTSVPELRPVPAQAQPKLETCSEEGAQPLLGSFLHPLPIQLVAPLGQEEGI